VQYHVDLQRRIDRHRSSIPPKVTPDFPKNDSKRTPTVSLSPWMISWKHPYTKAPTIAASRHAKRDKGFTEEMARFVQAIEQGGPPVMPFDQIEAVTRACLLAVRSLQTGETYPL
jgi:predicted dehydrogenase